MERPCAWKKYTPQQIEELEELCRGYKQFLSENKTERLCVKAGIKMAEEAGYVDLETVIAAGRELKAGDKVYAANHGKDLMLVNLGTAPLEQGFNILGAHVDSPRLDLKQNPAFEAGDMAYLDTHYYGGVKSYHWVASPLALVGVICKKDGTTVDINIGDKADDPVFTISDLLIHLSSEQMSKPAKDAVDAEILDVIVGGRPVKFDEDDKDAPKEPVKQMFLDILKEQYEILAKEMIKRDREGRGFTFYHYMIDLTGGPCIYKRISGCGSGTEYMAVTPWGDLYPCHQFVGDPKYLMGDIWKGVTNTAVRDEFKHCNAYARPECKDCWAKLYCSGGCAANAYHATGSITGVYEYGCELFKKRVECAIMIKVAENQELAAQGIEVPIELGGTCNACADGEACE